MPMVESGLTFLPSSRFHDPYQGFDCRSLTAAAFAQPRAATPADVFFSKTSRVYNNKALEIQRHGRAVISPRRRSTVQMYFNGSPTPGLTISTGTVASGEVFVLAQSAGTRPSSRRPISSTAAAGSTGTMRWHLEGRSGGNGDRCDRQIGIDPGAEWGSGSPAPWITP